MALASSRDLTFKRKCRGAFVLSADLSETIGLRDSEASGWQCVDFKAFLDFTTPAYHLRHDQYLAVILLGGLESHRCLARKLFLRPGMDFLMVILGSPKRMVFDFPPEQARTTNFFDPPGVRRGLLHGRFLGFIEFLS